MNKMKKYRKVAVLKGGVSSERDISLRSGAAIAQGLRDDGFDVVEIDIVAKEFTLPSGVEAAFVALHGTFGEDGEIQKILTDLRIPFTGSDAESCRVAFDKVLTRKRLAEHGIPVPKGEVLTTAATRTLPLPLVVKPPREGSSVGCHLVFEEAQWSDAFSDAVRHSGEALVEQYIPGRELTVSIVDGQVLPVVEIKTASGWYDFDAKYVTGETQYIVPAELPPATTTELQTIAIETFRALNSKGFGRVDFRLSPEGRPYVLELNSIPGFTATSLLPKAAQAAGIDFPELCGRIMELAEF